MYRLDAQWAILILTSLMFGLSLSIFLILHVSLIWKNQTTLESMQREKPIKMNDGSVMLIPQKLSLYDVGIKDNFAQVFGNRKLLWGIPIHTS